MKRLVIAINDRELHVYLDGDQVDLGRSGIAPMQRSPIVEILDEIPATLVEYQEEGHRPKVTALESVNVSYQCVVRRIEDL